MASRIDDVGPTPDEGNRRCALSSQRAGVGGAVNAERKAGNHDHPCISEPVTEFACDLSADRTAPTSADNRNGR